MHDLALITLSAGLAVAVMLGLNWWDRRPRKSKYPWLNNPLPGGVESNYAKKLLNDPGAQARVARAESEGWTARPGWTRLDVEYGGPPGELPYRRPGGDDRYRPAAELPLVLRLQEWSRHYTYAAKNSWKATPVATELLLMDLLLALNQVYLLMDSVLQEETSLDSKPTD